MISDTGNRIAEREESPVLYPGRTLKACVSKTTRGYFDLEPCPNCGNKAKEKFLIATLGHKEYAMQCQVCAQYGPITCHVNGCIAFMRWCNWVEELRELAAPLSGIRYPQSEIAR
jgi:hypothetical protein